MVILSSSGDDYTHLTCRFHNRKMFIFPYYNNNMFCDVDSKKIVFIARTESYFQLIFQKIIKINDFHFILMKKSENKNAIKIFQFSDISIFVIAVIHLVFDFHYLFNLFWWKIIMIDQICWSKSLTPLKNVTLL